MSARIHRFRVICQILLKCGHNGKMIGSIKFLVETQVRDQRAIASAHQLSVFREKKEFADFVHSHQGMYEELEERLDSLHTLVSRIAAHL